MKRCAILLVLLLVNAASSSARAADLPITQDLYGYWSFEKNPKEDPRFIWDWSGAGHHCAYKALADTSYDITEPVYSEGILGTSLKLGVPTGPTEMAIAYEPKGKTLLTLSLWAWMDEPTTDATIASNTDKATFGYGHFRIFVRDGKLTAIFGVVTQGSADEPFPGACEVMETGIKFPLHEWHHIVLVMNEPEMRLYYDAVPVGHLVLKLPLRGVVTPRIVIGASRMPMPPAFDKKPDYKNTLGAWKGRVDEAALWIRPLTIAEVRGVHAATLAGKPVYAAVPIELWHEKFAVRATAAASVFALILLAASWGVHRLYTRRLRQRLAGAEMQWMLQNERRRISDDIHDELGSRLAKLVMHSELALAGGTDTGRHLQNVTSTAQDVARSLDELVWAVNPSNDSLPKFAAYLANHASEFLKDSGLALRLDIPDALPEQSLAANVRHELLLAAKEALTNIVKHANATEVGIKLRAEDGQITLQISDNGIGISENPPPGLNPRNGFRTMSDRLERVGGKCTVGRREGSGTVVELSVSTRR